MIVLGSVDALHGAIVSFSKLLQPLLGEVVWNGLHDNSAVGGETDFFSAFLYHSWHSPPPIPQAQCYGQYNNSIYRPLYDGVIQFADGGGL